MFPAYRAHYISKSSSTHTHRLLSTPWSSPLEISLMWHFFSHFCMRWEQPAHSSCSHNHDLGESCQHLITSTKCNLWTYTKDSPWSPKPLSRTGTSGGFQKWASESNTASSTAWATMAAKENVPRPCIWVCSLQHPKHGWCFHFLLVKTVSILLKWMKLLSSPEQHTWVPALLLEDGIWCSGEEGAVEQSDP